MSRLPRFLSLCLLISGLAAAEPAALWLPSVFSDHMVLQRDQKIPVWGKAAAGEAVTVSFGASTAKTKADKDGHWKVLLDKSPANAKPQTLSVKAATTISFADVLVGDVWLCSGQSNMEFGLKFSHNGEAVLPTVNDPLLRLFSVTTRFATKPDSDVQTIGNKPWRACTPQEADFFTAVGYFVGRELRKDLNIPIGLIASYQGGSTIQVWTSVEAFEKNAAADPAFAAMLAKRKTALETYGDKLPDENDYNRYSSFMIGNLYHTMIAPLIPYGIKGVLWYQGESNANGTRQYQSLFATLINDWRARWGQGDFPFLYVQLPGQGKPSTEAAQGNDGWVVLRETQARTLALPNTGMATAIDIGEEGYHPKDKIDVGLRLALVARRQVYGEKIVASGPVFKKLSVQGATAWLDFDSVGGGLVISSPPWVAVGEVLPTPSELTGFAIAGADKVWHHAKARIEKNRIAVSSAEVAQPVAVRYAWTRCPPCSLYNAEKLPAAPFRTDDW